MNAAGQIRFTAAPALIFLAAALSLAYGQDNVSRGSSDRLASIINARQSSITAWSVEYESMAKMTKTKIDGSYVHRYVGIRRDSFYVYGAHGTQDYDWREDPFSQQLFVNPGKAFVVQPNARSFTESPLVLGATLPGSAVKELALFVFSYWPCETLAPPTLSDGNSALLRDAVKFTKYHFEPQRQFCNELSCDVLTLAGTDRLWFDSTNLDLVQREFFAASDGRIAQRLEFFDQREIAPGVRFPMRWHNVVFDSNDLSANEIDRRKVVDAMINVLDVRLNGEVSPELFVFKPMPGMIRVNEDESYEQVATGGLEYLDWMTTFLSKVKGWKSNRRILPSCRPIGSDLLYLLRYDGRCRGVCVFKTEAHFALAYASVKRVND